MPTSLALVSSSATWPAPLSDRALDAVVEVPGSKSITNRALVLAAISDGSSLITRPLHSRDTTLMAQALRSLGIGGSDVPDPDSHVRGWRVDPRPMHGPTTIDCGLAGTVMRFVPPLAAFAHGPVTFDGDERARQRPMAPIIESLRALGVIVEDEGRGCLPFIVNARGGAAGGTVTLDASASSQFVSALLLVGSQFDDGVTVQHRGGPMPSLPHIDMTVQMLRRRGVHVEADTSDPTRASWHVASGPVRALDVAIEPDLSNAAPFLAAAAVAGGSVSVAAWPDTTTQAGDAFPALLTAMGASVTRHDGSLTVTGTGELHGIDADMREVGELVPTLAAVAALADSPTTITGVAHLRGHETDRLAALVSEIKALGGKAEQLDDGLRIAPAPLHGGIWHTYNDHRMATAGAIIGLRVGGVEVEDVETTAKTLPGFTSLWQAMLGRPAPASAEMDTPTA